MTHTRTTGFGNIWGGAVCLAAGAALFAACAMPAMAQQTNEPGQTGVRIQGEEVPAAPLPPVARSGPALDYRQEMRDLIEKMAAFARGQKQNFAIIARDAGDLIIKIDPQDDKIVNPARTFMRSIDGIMFDGVSAGYRVLGQPPPEPIRTQMLDRIARAKRAGLNVLTMEFASDPATIDRAYRAADNLGIVAAVVPVQSDDLTSLPAYPRRPFRENPNNIISVPDVRNYAYIADASGFGRQDQFALDIQATNFDLIIVDPFIGREALSKRAIETMKYKKLGAKRLVFARIDVGTAASYRFYWKPDWNNGGASFLAGPYPGDPDRQFVEYWNGDWQRMLFGGPESYLAGIIGQGYDGVVLEGLRNYLAFEGNVEIPEEFAPLALTPPTN